MKKLAKAVLSITYETDATSEEIVKAIKGALETMMRHATFDNFSKEVIKSWDIDVVVSEVSIKEIEKNQ